MKVLWFTNTASLYKNENHLYYGGGWIKSLEELIIEQTEIDLGIAFLHATDSKEQQNGRVTYYPVLKKNRSKIGKLINNWSCKIEGDKIVEEYLRVIKHFKPDVIQIFGTEGSFGWIQNVTNVPVIIHIQGIISSCANAFYPPGVNNYNILTHAEFFKNQFFGNSLIFDKKRFNKQAERELIYFKKAKNLMGRTHWDKTVSHLLAPQATYFHIDEVLRPVFYSLDEWVPKERNKFVIVSTISSTIYKGFDMILKTAKLLRENTTSDFEWQIAGVNENDKLIKFIEKIFKINSKECNIRFVGKKTDNELILMLKEADVYVHASYIDNSPNSLCEAQILGIPVIACNVGGINSLIDDQISGVLVPSNAPYEMAIEIISVVTDKIKASNLGKCGKEKALVRHNRKKILTDLNNAYRKIIGTLVYAAYYCITL